MSLVLNTTLADQFSNSYVDIAYCDDYWTMHYNATRAAQWAALTTPQKTSALIAACRVIETARFTNLKQPRSMLPLRYDRHSRMVITLEDQLCAVKWIFTQNLQFPRNLDHDFTSGALFIPEPIMNAQCEQAVYLLNFDDTAIASRMQGITEDITNIGNIHTRQNFTTGGSAFSPAALEMCRPFFLRGTSQNQRA